VLLIATPFLIPEIAVRYGVSEGTAATLSVVQVGAFALATLFVPRVLAPSGSLLRRAAFMLAVLNVLSAVPDVFWILVVLRGFAGGAAGVLAWIAWTEAMRSRASMADIAAAGPLGILVVAPILGFLSGYGDQALYVGLGILTIPAAVASCEISGTRRRRGVISRSRSNRVLLVALSMVTFFGSALTVTLVIVGRDLHGVSASATSVAFSINAVASLFGARMAIRGTLPGVWLISTGLAAMLTVIGPAPLFFFGIAWWGLSYWISVPGVFVMLSARSLEPGERAGDAQGLMAIGRALGPAMSAPFVDAGALVALGIVCGAGMLVAGATVIGVTAGRSLLPPTDSRTSSSGDEPSPPETRAG
jgi:hypothetical protein